VVGDSARGEARYDAFLSYSRAADEGLASALQRGLQRFAKPWYRLRVLRVFRDDASLSANPGLWTSISRALAASRYFVLLASPDAAGSKWVGQEVQQWLESGRIERLLLVVTDGEVRWDDHGDWDEASAVPVALHGAFREEPRYVDLRWAHHATDLSLRNPRFRDAVADLAATLQGRAKDELIGEDVRQHRRTVRLARAAAATLTLLTVAAATLAVLAIRSRDQAKRQASIATSRALAAESETSVTNGRLDLGLLLGAQAYRTSRTPEARSALANALIGSSHVTRLLTDEPLALASGTGAGRIALARRNGQVVVWDVLRAHRVGRPASLSSRPDVIALSADGRTLAVGAVVIGRVRGTNLRYPSVAVWDVDGSRWIVPVGKIAPSFGAAINDVAVSGDGSRVAWWDGRPGVVQVGVWNGRSVSSSSGLSGAVPCEVLLNADGSLLAVVASTLGVEHLRTEVAVWQLGPSGVVPRDPATVFRGRLGYAPNTSGCAPHGSGGFDPTRPEVFALGGWDGTVRLWDARAGVQLGRALHGGSGVVSQVSFSPDGRRLLARDLGGLTMWNLADRQELPAPRSDSASDLGAWLLAGGRSIATVGYDGNLAITDERSPASRLTARLGAGFGRATFSPEGGLLGAVDAKGVIRFWSTGSWRASGPSIATGLADARFAYSQDGRRLLAWSPQASRATIWDVATRRPVGHVDAKGDQFFFDANSRVLAVATGIEDARVTDTSSENGSPVTLRSSSDATALGLDPHGTSMLLSTDWGTGVWDLRTGRRTSSAFPAGAAAWNPARAELATGERDGTLEVWDLRTGALRSAFRSFQKPLAVRFGAGGSFLAVLGDGVQIWDIARQSLLGSRSFAGGRVETSYGTESLDFSPSGKALVASGPKGTLVRWDLDPQSWLRIACRLAGRRLTHTEWSRFVGARRYASAC
jgi:WD40 repeat protein